MQPVNDQSPLTPNPKTDAETLKPLHPVSPLAQAQLPKITASPGASEIAEILGLYERSLETGSADARTAVNTLARIIQNAKAVGDTATLAEVVTAINQQYYDQDQYFGGPRNTPLLVEVARSDYAPLRKLAMRGMAWFDAARDTSYCDNKRDIDSIVKALGATRNDDERAMARRIAQVTTPNYLARLFLGAEPSLKYDYHPTVTFGFARLLAGDPELASDKNLQKTLATISEIEIVKNSIYDRSPPLGNWRRMRMRR